jgi:amino acid permease
VQINPVAGQHLGLVKFVAWLYMIWYLFRGMRDYYGQGRALTFLKYLQVGLSYITAAVMVLVMLALYTAVTLE